MQWIIDAFVYDITTYYGLDWAAGLFMILSLWRLKHHHRDGFVHAALAALCWIGFNLIAKSPPGFVLNAVVGAMAVHSWVNFKPPSQSPLEAAPPDPT